jgi:hypothetical protein
MPHVRNGVKSGPDCSENRLLIFPNNGHHASERPLPKSAKGDAKLLRRRHDPRALLRYRPALQGKRLVTKQHLNHHLARIAGIK